MTHNRCVVGIDVGGTHIASILANEKGEVLQESIQRFQEGGSRKVQTAF